MGETVSADTDSAPDTTIQTFKGKSASSALRWSAMAVIGKQAMQLVFGIVLARILGPHTYGIVGEATIFATLSMLLLDQGLSSALVQRKDLNPDAPGAAQTLNLISGVVLGLGTWVAAPAMADFFHTSQLVPVLRLLGCGLLLKAAAVTPRAMLSRRLRFASMAKADLGGAALGSMAGITAATMGASYYSLVVQIFVTDAVTALVLLMAAKGPRPNANFRELMTLLPFGLRIFATNMLAYFSRNIDNAAVGRYLGTSSLAFYSMAYRVLVIPVQLLGQTVNRVLFPVFSRMAGNRKEVARTLITATEMLTLGAVPLMTFVACSAHELVLIGLGHAWLPAAPLIAVLALAGARETVFYITPALMTALGRADWNLRFEIVATGVQVAGIFIGLQWGVLGVAAGYAIAGLLLTPLPMVIQRRLTGVTLRQQVRAMWPAIHASSWAAAGYLLLGVANLPTVVHFVAGAVIYAVILVAILAAFHRESAARTFRRLSGIRPGRSTNPVSDDKIERAEGAAL